MRCLSPIRLVTLRVLINRLRNLENHRKLENYLSQEIQKAKNCLSLKNRFSQEKNSQKVRIHLILMLKRPNQVF